MENKSLTVGIVGGTGQMGALFKKNFKGSGCRVLVSSRKTSLKPEDCAKKSDVIIISVPISSTIEVIKKVAPKIKKNSLLMDMTSLKEEPVKAMLKYSNCDVIGMHPLFGPNIKSLKKQTIILCPARTKTGKWLKWIKGILVKNGAILKITTPKKHDEMMSIIQGLTHFSALNVAHTIGSLRVGVNNSLEYTSPIYKLRMVMVARILNQDPNLYADIEIANPQNKKAIRAYINSAKKLEKIIETKNRKEFLKYFRECSKSFGDFKNEAERTSDYLIEKMVEKD